MTIRLRIIIPFVILFIAVFAVTAIFSILLVSKAVEERIIDQMRNLSTFISQSTSIPINEKSLEHIKKVFNAEILIKEGKVIHEATLTSKEISEFENVSYKFSSTSETDVTEIILANNIYQMIYSNVIINKSPMVLYLFFPGELISKEKTKAIMPLIIIAFAGSLLVIVLGYITAHKISKPITQLASLTKEIAHGKLDLTIETSYGASELRQLADSFNKMLEGLKKYEENLVKTEKLATMGQMALGIAHEIRNPLTSMKMTLQMLLNEAREEKESFEVLLREIERLELAVSELFSATHSSKLKLENVNINKVSDEILELMARQLEHLSINVEKHYNDLPQVKVDKNKFKRAIMNLILNGAQAMPSGGKLTISTQKINETNIVRISIKDEGKGIPIELREKVFEPFVSTKEGGVGLGLSVTRKIIEEHNGKIDFETGDSGTTFWVDLPHK